jgi:putative tryptophan/tyrosine transport system substrate-binding protein
MDTLRRATIWVGALALMVLVTYGRAHLVAATSAVRVVVLMSHNANPYQEALEGFRDYLSVQKVPARFDVYHLEGDIAKAAPAFEKVRMDQVDLVFTLGSFATGVAVKSVDAVPIIAGLVLSTEELGRRANATGVALEFPLETQLQWLVRVLPDCKRVGVLYDPAKKSQQVEAAGKIAQKMGLKLYAQKVETPSELPSGLNSLANRVDVLLGLADDLIYTPQTAKHILLFSFRNRIPLIGLSDEWVKAGALYSLDWDYQDLGRQCAEMAQKVLQGNPVSSCPPAYPRKVLYSVNLKTASHMKVQIPESLIQGSHRVFQ